MGDRLGRDPRLERLKHNVPPWYVPLHLGVTIGLLLGTSVALLALRPDEPLTVAALIASVAVVLLVDFVEYALHRWPMHRRRRLTRAFFRNHTIGHHRFFTHMDMEVGGLREITFVVSSVPVILFSLSVVAVVTVGLVLCLGVSDGIFVGAVLGLYGTFKQLLHVAFHLPEPWMRYPVLRGRLFQAMRIHHTIHHDPRMMTQWNFNIGPPIFDALFGTLTWERTR